ncbi:MAG: hypothetical protein ABIT71_06670 [Vicinamibacteraceae bacterium]
MRAFVEIRPGSRPGERTLVVGTPPSEPGLREDLVDDVESAFAVLERRGWVSAFSDIELVVPQPLMTVSAPVELIRSLMDKGITRPQFQERWHLARLGSP